MGTFPLTRCLTLGTPCALFANGLSAVMSRFTHAGALGAQWHWNMWVLGSFCQNVVFEEHLHLLLVT